MQIALTTLNMFILISLFAPSIQFAAVIRLAADWRCARNRRGPALSAESMIIIIIKITQ